MASISSKLKNILPTKIIYWYYLRKAKREMLPDLRRRVKDKVYDNSKEDKLKRNLTLFYHIIEKGLTMPEPRPGFGKAIVIELGKAIFEYHKLGLILDKLEFKQAVSVLKEYKEFHAEINFTLDNEVETLIARIENQFPNIDGIKQIHTTREQYFKAINEPFDKFCLSRYSVRNYTSHPIPTETLYKCINLAQKSPSFCNRQPTRVHIVKSEKIKNAILAIQNGNRGFGNLAETLLVVTSVISYTRDTYERNENHLNGGVFSMTLLNALHYHEIGACALNWSVYCEKDQKIRELLNLPENEIVLMIISCGFIPDKISIASSPRKDAKEITTLHL